MKRLLVAWVGARLDLDRAIAAAPDVPRDARSDTDLSPEPVLRSSAGNDLASSRRRSPSLTERLVPRDAAPVPPSRRLDATQILRPLLAEPSYLRV